jgi:hypothetical protein
MEVGGKSSSESGALNDQLEPIPWRGPRAIEKLIGVLLLIAAAAVLAFPLLDVAFLRRLARGTGTRPLIAWLANDNNAWIAGAALLAALLAFVLWVRHRLVNNKRLWFSTGCPNCMERELVRVSRRSSDRFYAFIGVPAYRYACRNCTWRGLRIARREYSPERERELEEALLRFQPDRDLDLASSDGESPTGLTHAPSPANSFFRDAGDVVWEEGQVAAASLDEPNGSPEPGDGLEEERSPEELEWVWRRSSDR